MRALLLLSFFISSLAYANLLQFGETQIILGSNQQVEYELYETAELQGMYRLYISVSSNENVDMYVTYNNDLGNVTSSSYRNAGCAPQNGAGDNEECFINLEGTSASNPYKIIFHNPEGSLADIEARLYSYNCQAYLYSTREKQRICPVFGTKERNDRSQISQSYEATGSTGHINMDTYAKDLNWKSGNYDEGKRLFAGIAGRVIFAGDYGDRYGNQVIIYNDDYNFALRYTHLDSYPSALEDRNIAIGEYIGTIGKTGLEYKPDLKAHLHLVAYEGVDEHGQAGTDSKIIFDRLDNGNLYSETPFSNPESLKAQFEFPSRFEFCIQNSINCKQTK